MQPKQPSRTAFAAAAHRAAHQLLEEGAVFRDPLAVAILGVPPQSIVDYAQARPTGAGMRFFIAARTAFAEACAAEGVASRGVRQLVVLGAGLDTFAYRNPLAEALAVFEVDHPATQAWKRERLAEAGIAAPESLIYAPVDFEREALGEGLASAGFDPRLRTIFLWLGVVPYLTDAAIEATLAFIGGLPGGGEVVFDYAEPSEALSPQLRAIHDERARLVASLGEPFLSAFDPPVLHTRLAALGFAIVEDLGIPDLVARYLSVEALAATLQRQGSDRGGHVLFAATAAA